MIHLLISTEGPTELAFVKQVLAPHLSPMGIYPDGRSVRSSRDRHKTYRGGLSKFEKAENDIKNWLSERKDPNCRFTTMYDYYGLPTDFPGYSASLNQSQVHQKVKVLEDALQDRIGDRRFFPYIQVHEFEALIFADPSKLDIEYLDDSKAIKNLIKMVEDTSPEELNNSPDTAPSKRIQAEIEQYDKVGSAVSVVKAIGLTTIRERCPHFNEWLTKLESLST